MIFMRAVIQRCESCSILSEGNPVGSIGRGLVVLLGVKKGDSEKDVEYIANKICQLRVFEDDNQKMNRSLLDISGELAIVSQFTLYGDARKGRRPSFTEAESPERAEELYRKTVEACRAMGIKTETGRFQTDMKISLVNDGPVTILLDSSREF